METTNISSLVDVEAHRGTGEAPQTEPTDRAAMLQNLSAEERHKIEALIVACAELGFDAFTLPLPGANDTKDVPPAAIEVAGFDLAEDEIDCLRAIIEPLWGRRWSDWVLL